MAIIYLAESDTTQRRLMEIALRADGYEVVCAANRGDLLERCRERHADLVIADLLMPVEGGVGTIAEIRRLNPGARIVALSLGDVALDGHGPNSALRDGADEVVAKPFPLADLKAVIRRLLGRASVPPPAVS